MPFTQIDDAPLRAEKLSETGAVYYLRWRDAKEELYVQITDIYGSRGVGNGTFSRYLFPFDDIGMKKVHLGYNPVDESLEEVRDNNMSGFLRAVKNDIIRRSEDQLNSKFP